MSLNLSPDPLVGIIPFFAFLYLSTSNSHKNFVQLLKLISDVIFSKNSFLFCISRCASLNPWREGISLMAFALFINHRVLQLDLKFLRAWEVYFAVYVLLAMQRYVI